MPRDSEVMRALTDYFKEGGRPLQVVPVICDAWEVAMSELNQQGNWELEKLIAAKRV